MTPGAYALTVIPCCAQSIAALCVSPRTANFDAEYGERDVAPFLPAIEDAPTMRPPRPCAIICAAACL